MDAGPGPTPPPVPAPRDAAPPPPPVTPYEAACASLKSAGCKEGLAANCAAVMRRVAEFQLTKVNVPCLVAAKTKTAVRACGHFATCP
jgi:hypothetical protein